MPPTHIAKHLDVVLKNSGKTKPKISYISS
jgi:hypothetical protein